MMNRFHICLSVTGLSLLMGASVALAQANKNSIPAHSEVSDPPRCPAVSGAQTYDVIIFGDEVPGVMTALKVKRELVSRNQSSRVALITEGDTGQGIGGHLVRGGLAYLDRNQVPKKFRAQYGLFGTPNRLYKEFLGMGRVKTIALDRVTLSQNFKRVLGWKKIDVIGNVELETVKGASSVICSFTASGQTYQAKYYIDASQGGELAGKSGVAMMEGFEAIGFPDSTLSLGLVLEFYGVPIDKLRDAEATLISRLLNAQDTEAQKWLAIASGNNLGKRQDLIQSLLDQNRKPKVLYQATVDSADVRSLAFSIAVHGQLGKEYDLKSSGFLFDRANIAVLPDRLSFNALLFFANADQAKQLSHAGGQPTPEMMVIATEIKTLFERLGVPRVEIMDELYIRNAGQIANPVDELSASLMTAGGVSAIDALGTFGYHLDDRGGIDGLAEKVKKTALKTLNFHQLPVFNYGFRHTLPQERQNLAVLGPASGFGGIGTTAGRIVELNVGVGEGLGIAMATAIADKRSLHTISNAEVRKAMGYTPAVYGERTGSFQSISSLESQFRSLDFEESYLNQAEKFLKEGSYVEATRVLSRAIALEPKNANAYFLRGNSLLNLRVLESARSDFTDAIRLNPNLVEAYLRRGYLNIFVDNYNQAIDDLDQVLRRDPNRPEAQFGKVLALSFKQSALTGKEWYTEALPSLNRAIQQQPQLAIGYEIRGIALAKSGDRDAAQIDFEKAIALYNAKGNQLAIDSLQRTIKDLRD